jgi:hypothetical protein
MVDEEAPAYRGAWMDISSSQESGEVIDHPSEGEIAFHICIVREPMEKDSMEPRTEEEGLFVGVRGRVPL